MKYEYIIQWYLRLCNFSRHFVTRAEVVAIDDNLTSKGDHVCLLLFSDCIEVIYAKPPRLCTCPDCVLYVFAADKEEKRRAEPVF